MILNCDCMAGLRGLADGSVNCCVTSPPYFGLRDYGVDGQIGLEASPDAYVARLVEVFREVRRVLRDDGTLWLNLGDSYAAGGNGGHAKSGSFHGHSDRAGDNKGKSKRAPEGYKPKDLIGIPWMAAFALRSDGWYLRQDIIWAKPNPMPESCRDRCTKAHEYVFLLSKSRRYYWDRDSMQVPAATASYQRINQPNIEGQAGSDRVPGKTNGPMKAVMGKSGNKARKDATGRGCPSSGVDGNVPWEGMTANRRSVWTVTTKPCNLAHFATFPPDLIRPMIRAGCPPGGVVLDPFAGAGTTGLVCSEEGREHFGFELNKDYCDIANKRISELLVQEELILF